MERSSFMNEMTRWVCSPRALLYSRYTVWIWCSESHVAFAMLTFIWGTERMCVMRSTFEPEPLTACVGVQLCRNSFMCVAKIPATYSPVHTHYDRHPTDHCRDKPNPKSWATMPCWWIDNVCVVMPSQFISVLLHMDICTHCLVDSSACSKTSLPAQSSEFGSGFRRCATRSELPQTKSVSSARYSWQLLRFGNGLLRLNR